MFQRERVSEAQPLAETGEGHVGGKRQRNTQGKTKLGGLMVQQLNIPTACNEIIVKEFEVVKEVIGGRPANANAAGWSSSSH